MAASSSLYEYLDLDPCSPPKEECDDPYARRLSMGQAATPAAGAMQAGAAGAGAPQSGTEATPAATAGGPSPAGGYATLALAAAAAAATPACGGGAAHAPFATAATLGECLSFLQPSLEAAGVRSRLPDPAAAAADPAAALASALCVAYDLLRLLQRSGEQRERQEELVSRLRVDARTADRTAQRLKGQSEQQVQEAAGLKIKLRQLDSWYRSEVDRWALERDELAKRNAQLEQRQAQWVYEMRRRDAEFEKLQGRLRALLRANVESRVTGLEEPAEQRSSPRAVNAGHPAVDTRQQAARQRQQQPPAPAEALRGGNSGAGGRPRSGARGPPGSQRSADEAPDAGPLPGAAADAAAPAADPAAAWHEVGAKLAALRARARRVDGGAAGGGGGGGGVESLLALAQQAGTPQERLLVAKLMEASSIMQEQEQTLKVAIDALAGGGQHQGGAES